MLGRTISKLLPLIAPLIAMQFAFACEKEAASDDESGGSGSPANGGDKGSPSGGKPSDEPGANAGSGGVSDGGATANAGAGGSEGAIDDGGAGGTTSGGQGGANEAGAAGGSVPIGGDRVIVWKDDFETGFGDWAVEGGDWSIGAPVRSSNRPKPYSGQNLAGTAIAAGGYGANRDARLISPPIAIPPASDRPRLRFAYWHLFSGADYGQLQIRTVDGEWQDLEVFDQNGSHWRQRIVDLSAYSEQTVELGFRLVTDALGTSTGLFIDDVSVETGSQVLTNPETFENGYGDWSVEGGDWAIGLPVRSSNRPAPHTGENLAGSGLNTGYRSDRSSLLVSPEFVVPPEGERPSLNYWYWYWFASGDYAQLQIRQVGGEWQDVADGRFDQSGPTWSQKSTDLRPYAGQFVQLGFRLVTNASGTYTGLFIDDLSIDTE